jgi:hypothetical protein
MPARDYRDTAKAPGGNRKFSFAVSDRFGDAPPRTAPKAPPRFGGAAPAHIANGFVYKQEELTRTGTAPTAVEKWDHSKPMGSKNRRPNEHDWKIYGLGPARYTPDKLAPIAGSGRLAPNPKSAIIRGGPPKFFPPDLNFVSADLMYSAPTSIGPKAIIGKREPAFGSGSEMRMEHRSYPTLEADSSASELIRRAKQRKKLTSEQRRVITADRRADHDQGAASYMSYMPRSDFGQSTKHSASFSFGSSLGSARFNSIAPSASEKAAERRRTHLAGSQSAVRMGAAYRDDPKQSPGPGDYNDDEGRGISGGGFDGSGRLVMSKSSPAFTLTGKVPLARLTGSPFIVPEPGIYFQ